MTGENNTLGLDALNDDFTISDDGAIEEQIPGFLPSVAEELDEQGNKIIKNTPSEETNPPGLPPETVAEDKDKVKTPEDLKSDSSPGLSKIYSSLATHLSEEGVLPSLNLEETDVTDSAKLAEAIKTEIESRLEATQLEYKKAMEEGVPKDEFTSYQKVASQLDAITDETIESDDERAIELRKNIIAQDFLNKGFPRDEALKYAQRSVDLGEDVTDAKTSLTKLKEHNTTQYQTAVQAAKDKETSVHTDIRKFIDTTEEVIKGIKINKGIKDKLYEQIITPVGRDENGKPINAFYKAYNEDPVKSQVIQNYLFMATKGYTDFSKINNVATSNVSKQIDEVLRNNGASFLENGGVNFNNRSEESTFSLGGDLKLDI